MENEQKVNSSLYLELAKNPDYAAFEALKKQLMMEHLGSWIIVADAKVEFIGNNEEEIWQKVNREFLNKSIFVTKITEEKSILYFRSPFN